ncbi:MAG TPA: PAS domain S-box protein, partial [Usitatibacter sp.]|nr:PAS domain S-box protein [Usitatibacter sp.]
MAYAVVQSPDFEALRATVEFAPLGMAHFDPHGRILLVNRRLCEMLGYTRDELMRRDFLQLTFHQDVAECRAMIERLAAGEIPFFSEEKRFVRADGSIVWSCVTVSAAPEVEGRAPFFIGIAEDITQKRARDAELAALANAIPQMVWISDSFGRRSWFNNRWYEYTGLAFEDVRDLGWQRVHHPDHRERVTAGLMAALARGEGWEDTFPLRRFDGEYRWFLSCAVPVRDEAGTVIRWFGSNTDVTEHLEALRTAELARKQREEMVAAVAHDLRNPVHTIVLAAATLETPALADERRTRLAGIVKNTSLRMGRLLDDLLDFSRMESG